MSKLVRGDIVVINVPKGCKPKHGWGAGVKNHALAIVSGQGTTYSHIRTLSGKDTAHENTELVMLKHPQVALFSALGRGVATAIIDASDKADAVSIAEEMLTKGRADVTGRTLWDLPWSVDSSEEMTPILVGIEDKKGVIDSMRAVYFKGAL